MSRDWRLDALCAQTDPDAFHPETGGATATATAVCRRCPARRACLDHALTTGELHGVWGGTTAQERRRLLKARATS